MFASILAATVYAKIEIELKNSDTDFKGDIITLMNSIGLEDAQRYKLNDYYSDDDISEIGIGHKLIKYKNKEKEIIIISVRGTNGTAEEWSSNFDIGADTDNYYDKNNADWKNKENHKGFDVASNRLINYIDSYIATNIKNSADKVIYLTGHSRGAGISNIVGAYYEDKPSIKTYVYTFATPNSTTSNKIYNTIFNVINEDDLVPYIPPTVWSFKNYGTTKGISVASKYEFNINSDSKIGTFKELIGKDYNSDSGTKRTVEILSKLAKNRNELYEYKCTFFGDGSDNTTLHSIKTTFDENSAKKAANDYYNKLPDRLKRFAKTKYNSVILYYDSETGAPIYGYETYISQIPAFAMQAIAYLPVEGLHALKSYNVAPKYEAAKTSFLASSGKLDVGGMADPHRQETYYLIARNNFLPLK